MELVRETEWRTFEEVLALAMGWEIEEAQELVKQYDEAAGETPFEFPDPIDELYAKYLEKGDEWYENFHDPDAPEDRQDVAGRCSAPDIAADDLQKYRELKQLLRLAVQNKDINYQYPSGNEDALYKDTVLNPVHVSRWLSAVRLGDMGALVDRIAALEKENAALKRQIDRRNKFKDDITARYLNVAIQEYYLIWHGRDDTQARPQQPDLIAEIAKRNVVSGAVAEAIEKVICPVERNRAKKPKKAR